MIDLRSDTITQPTAQMLEAMLSAKVGDDVFSEDPTVNELEHTVAQLFQKEVGLFCPSGTMANQIAIKTHTNPGDELITSRESHIYCYEGGGIAMNAGISARLIEGVSGMITASDVKNNINPDDVHFPITKLVSLENTSNRGGGCCYELDELQKIKTTCDENNLILHLDGARIFNAIVAKNHEPSSYGTIFDSISICLSKGLGAPIGSVLIGSQSFIKKARRTRKVLGGGMRQAGYMAATGLYAVQNHIERLTKDHHHAKMIAEAAAKCNHVVSTNNPQTNIVMLEIGSSITGQDFVNKLLEKGISCMALGPQKVRMVTHLNTTEKEIEKVVTILRNLV